MTKQSMKWERLGGVRWSGKWRDVYSEDRRARVSFSMSRRDWRLEVDGAVVSRHNSRDGAMRKGAKTIRAKGK